MKKETSFFIEQRKNSLAIYKTKLLTLARMKTGERRIGAALAKSEVLDQPLSVGSLVVESVVLVKSQLKPTGSVYTRLWEARLRDS
jgi:2'-5' RNA ligase